MEGHKSTNNKFHPKEITNSQQTKINTSILQICKIPDSINIDDLKLKLNKYMESRKEFYNETERSLYVEDEFSEYWLAKVSGGEQVGKGNCGTDVITKNKEGIDAVCLIMNKIQTNEKSLMQNFNDAGIALDKLFIEEKYDDAVKLYIKSFNNKMVKIKEKYNLTDLYIFGFISTKNDIYGICFKIVIDNIKFENLETSRITKKKKNIELFNFIERENGNVKLYKSKKRLELRLNKDIIKNAFAVKLYTN